MWAFGAKDGASRCWFEIFEMSLKGRQLWWFCTDIWKRFYNQQECALPYRHPRVYCGPLCTFNRFKLASKYRMHPICTGVSPMLPHWKGQQYQQTLENGLHDILTRQNVKNMTCKWKSRYACEEWCTRTLGICKQVGLKICKGPTIQSPPHPICASGNQESLTASDGSRYRFHRFYQRYL